MSVEKDARVTVGKTACEGGSVAVRIDASGEPVAAKPDKVAAGPACLTDVVERLGEVLP